MSDNDDFVATDWLDWELTQAQRKVEEAEADLKSKKWFLRMSQNGLDHAVAKLDAIRLIITRTGLEGSANPADNNKEETGVPR